MGIRESIEAAKVVSIAANCWSAASKSSTISCAITSGIRKIGVVFEASCRADRGRFVYGGDRGDATQPIFLQLSWPVAGSIRETTEGITIMWKKFNVTVLAVLAFGFASALRLNAGTEVVEPYRAPAPTYNYAPPAPVYYAPPAVGVAVYPAFGFYGPRFGVFGVRRFHGPRVHWRSHHWR
jgi:hypothetical protein